MKASNAYAINVPAPSGSLTVVISEESNKPDMIQLYLGKTGSNVFAYLTTISSLITTLFRLNINIDEIISLLSNTTADKLVYKGNIPIRSDIDAIVYAMLVYKREKYGELHLPRNKILNQSGF